MYEMFVSNVFRAILTGFPNKNQRYHENHSIFLCRQYEILPTQNLLRYLPQHDQKTPSGYIDNTDGIVNPSRCIHRGRPFAGPGSRGRRLPRPWACKRPPEMDTVCEDFLPRLYCIYFTPCSRIVRIVHALYNLCCLLCGQGGGMGKNYF